MTTDPVQLLIEAGAIPANPFAPNSRYHGVAFGRYVRNASDPGVPYVLRRFIAQRRAIAIVAEHIVHSGERPDLPGATFRKRVERALGRLRARWRIRHDSL